MEVSTERLITEELVGDVTVLRMCDPARSNALTPSMVVELIRAFSNIRGKVVLLCAEGRNFCSGGDHTSFLDLSPEGRRRHVAELKQLMIAIRAAPVPTLACVQGAVIGGGLEIALQCDLIMAADDARFQLPHVATHSRIRAISYSALVARIGSGLARRMSLLGDVVPAASALTAGLVDHISRRPDLHAIALSIAAQLAAQPQDELAHARQALAGS